MATQQKYNPSQDPPDYSYENPQVSSQPYHQHQHYPQVTQPQPFSNVMPPPSTTNVVVVNQAPVAENRLILGPVIGHRDWTTDLCACMNDTGGCLWTMCCSTCVLADISAKLRENVCVTCCVPGGLITLRTRTRTLGGIQGSVCKDCFAINCCYCCAICQMSRELTAMGL